MPNSLFEMRFTLHDMEKLVGLTQFTSAERDVLYVIRSLMEKCQDVATHEILSHDLMENISRPTVYRAINRLLDENIIVKSEVADRGFYNISPRFLELTDEKVLRVA